MTVHYVRLQEVCVQLAIDDDCCARSATEGLVEVKQRRR